MRPQISALVRSLTYPDLVDSKNVKNRPHLAGIQADVIFVDHRVSEDAALAAMSSSQQSHINTFEAKMVACILRHLLLQGYKASQIVVLTPYLGQLQVLRNELPRVIKEIRVDFGDLDFEDLEKIVGEDAESIYLHTKKSESIRVATIDNYQGEESDIIIASLVRSNLGGHIGFLKETERVNVLLSRAKLGMILIGDSQCLRSSRVQKGRDLWDSLMELIPQIGIVAEGFPVRCERHPSNTKILREPKDFELYASNGGCDLECPMFLPCYHKCPRSCHFIDPVDGHKKVPCPEVVFIECPQGHKLKCTCGTDIIAASKECKFCKQNAKFEAELVKAKKEREVKVQELEHAMYLEMLEMEARHNKDLSAIESDPAVTAMQVSYLINRIVFPFICT